MLVSCACKPLITDELGSAVYINPGEGELGLSSFSPLDEDQLRDLWPDVVIADTGWNPGAVWRLSHFSVGQYFAEEPSLRWNMTDAHRYMLELCLKLLLDARYNHAESTSNTLDSTVQFLDPAHPLQVYARYYWVNHLQALEAAEAADMGARLWELLSRFLGSPAQRSAHFSNWQAEAFRDEQLGRRPETPRNQIDRPSLGFIESASPLFTMAQFSLFKTLGKWREDFGLDLSEINGRKQTLLEIVADGRPESIHTARKLVGLGADVNQPQENDYGTALTQAAALGDSEWFRFLLSRGANPDPITEGAIFGSPLAAAAFHGNEEIIELSLRAGADVNSRLRRGRFASALAAAASAMRPRVLQVLIDAGADVNFQHDQYRPLTDVAASGSLDCLQVLIDAGADVCHVGDFNPNMTIVRDPDVSAYPGALHAAASRGHLSCLRALIGAGATVWSSEEQISHSAYALSRAASRGHWECMRALLERGARVDYPQDPVKGEKFGSPLTAAAACGQLNCLRALIDAGADVNRQFYRGSYGSALTAAAATGANDCLQLLLDAGADANLHLRVGGFGSALAAAAATGANDSLRLLLGAGADANLHLGGGRFGSALAAAAVRGKQECLQALVDAGADPNQPLASGLYGSALAAAAATGAVDSLRFLIAAGADVNLSLGSGDFGSALAAAAACVEQKCLQVLINNGADAGQHLPSGYFGCAMTAAAWSGCVTCAAKLVRAGANVNQTPKAGSEAIFGSPLIAAAFMGKVECVQFLVKEGAKIGLDSEHGRYRTVWQAVESGTMPSDAYNLAERWENQIKASVILGGVRYKRDREQVAQFLRARTFEE